MLPTVGPETHATAPAFPDCATTLILSPKDFLAFDLIQSQMAEFFSYIYATRCGFFCV